MAVTIKDIIPSKQAESAQTTQYTASSVKAIIDKFTVHNTSSNNVAFAINLVTSGDTVGDENLLLYRTIIPGETYSCTEVAGQVLEPGGFISTIAGAATSLTIKASGREIS